MESQYKDVRPSGRVGLMNPKRWDNARRRQRERKRAARKHGSAWAGMCAARTETDEQVNRAAAAEIARWQASKSEGPGPRVHREILDATGREELRAIG